MFTQMKNIDSAFRYIRGFTLLVVAGATMTASVAIYESFRAVRATTGRVYVLAGGRAFEAVESARGDNLPVEARDHVRTFHRLFFTLDPDEEVIRRHISRALYLADASAKTQYSDLRERGYYAAVIAGNVSQRIEVDSIYLDTARRPAYFRCYATERIIRATSVVTRSLVTEGYLREVARSDHNAHGLLIERWRILENKDLGTRSR